MNKKLTFYEVKPQSFRDTSRDGIGDLKGLAGKSDYFKFLGVDAIILPNILSIYSNDHTQDYKRLSSKVGTINDLRLVMSKLSEFKTKVLIEMNIGTIKETHKWFENATEKIPGEYENIVEFKKNPTERVVGNSRYKYNTKTKSYYLINDKTQEINLNWKSDEILNKFVQVIKFWHEMGVSGFVFTDFERLVDPTEVQIMIEDTLKQLRRLFRSIKEIDDSLIIVGKSNIVPLQDGRQYTQGTSKIFDFFMPTQLSLLGTSKKFGTDVIGDFKPTELVREMSKIITNSSQILTFGSDLSGRVVSRWGDNGQYSAEVAKTLALLQLLTPSSASIYYGEEIGMKNIGLTHLDDFQDETLIERKRAFENQKISNFNFMKAQVLQNPINSNSLMQWNDEKNAGFSSAEKTITPISDSYREINVKNQFSDPKSTLNFYKKLLKIVSASEYSDLIQKGSYKISITKFGVGVIKVVRKHEQDEIIILANLSKKEKAISLPGGWQVILSSYAHKIYVSPPKRLLPYESIVAIKSSNKKIDTTQTMEVDGKKHNKAVKTAVSTKLHEELLKKEKLQKDQERSEISRKKAENKILMQKFKEQEKAWKEAKAAREQAEKNRILEAKEAIKTKNLSLAAQAHEKEKLLNKQAKETKEKAELKVLESQKNETLKKMKEMEEKVLQTQRSARLEEEQLAMERKQREKAKQHALDMKVTKEKIEKIANEQKMEAQRKSQMKADAIRKMDKDLAQKQMFEINTDNEKTLDTNLIHDKYYESNKEVQHGKKYDSETRKQNKKAKRRESWHLAKHKEKLEAQVRKEQNKKNLAKVNEHHFHKDANTKNKHEHIPAFMKNVVQDEQDSKKINEHKSQMKSTLTDEDDKVEKVLENTKNYDINEPFIKPKEKEIFQELDELDKLEKSENEQSFEEKMRNKRAEKEASLLAKDEAKIINESVLEEEEKLDLGIDHSQELRDESHTLSTNSPSYMKNDNKKIDDEDEEELDEMTDFFK